MKRVIELNMRLAIPIGILFLSFIGESFACAVVFLAPLVILFAVTFVSVIVCVIVRNERRCHAMRVAGPPEINIIFQRWLKQWKQPRFSLTDPENILNKLPYLPSAQSETIWPPPPKIDG
jgi:hypothetical protein